MCYEKTWMMLFAVLMALMLTGCGKETLDYNNPDVDLFVKQLKSGTYNTKNEKELLKFLILRKRIFPNYLLMRRI